MEKTSCNDFVTLHCSCFIFFIYLFIYLYVSNFTPHSPLTHEMDFRFVNDIHSFRNPFLRFDL